MKLSLVSTTFGAFSLLAMSAGATESVVHVEAKKAVRVERRVDKRWETACEAPCDQPLDDRAEYRFVDEGGPRASFRFHAREGETVTLRHEPRTATAPALMGAGGCLAGIGVVGLIGIVIDANARAAREANPEWQRSHDPGMGGIVYLAYGALAVVVIVGGGSMFIAGLATDAYDDGMSQRRSGANRPRPAAQPKLSAFPLGFTF